AKEMNKPRTQQDIEMLAKSECQLREVIDGIPVLIWRSGNDNLRNYFNLPWLTFTGRSLERELGMRWAQGLHPDDYDHYLTTYQSAFAARRSYTVDYRLRRRDGAYRWVRENGTPHFDHDGGFAGFLGAAIDISDREESSQALTATLAERDALLVELHHRAKNNLQIIVSLASLQSTSTPPPEARKQLYNLAERMQSMAIAEEQLYQARDFAEIDLGSYLGELARSLIAGHGRGVNFESRLTSIHVPTSQATPIGLIAHELIFNALKHAWPRGQRGTITVGAKTAGNTLEILIADNGVGLSDGF